MPVLVDAPRVVAVLNEKGRILDELCATTECLPLVTRDGSLVIEAMKHARSLFPWLLRGVDFDNDSAFMNDVVVPWCREP